MATDNGKLQRRYTTASIRIYPHFGRLRVPQQYFNVKSATKKPYNPDLAKKRAKKLLLTGYFWLDNFANGW